MIFLILLVSLLFLYFIYRKIYRNTQKLKFPPGPRGLPFFGNLLTFRRAPLNSMVRWSHEYGDIVGLQLGSYRTVMLSNAAVMKEAFSQDAFNGRPKMRTPMLLSGGVTHGTLTSEGAAWFDVRNITVKTLNKNGFGKKETEGQFLETVDDFFESFSKELDSVNLHDKLYVPVSRYVWEMLTGQALDNDQCSTLGDALNKLHWAVWPPIGSLMWFMPELTDYFPGILGYNKAVTASVYLHELLNAVVEKRQKTFLRRLSYDSSGREIKGDLVGTFLHKIEQAKRRPSSTFHGLHGENHMKGMVMNMYTTAVESVTNTLNWAFVYLSKYPSVQEKVYEEIIKVIGPSRKPCLNDATTMPYTNAFMKEVLRIATTSPYSNFQETVCDVEFGGYWIPKGTLIIGNIYGAHHDEKLWEDPEEFRVERFLETDMDKLPPFIPFSVGLRTCIGQTYAKSAFFLYMTSLCQRYTIEFDTKTNPVPTRDEISRDCLVSVFRFAKFYKYTLKERT